MSVKSDILEIKTVLEEEEADAHGRWKRSLRRVHNLLAAKLVTHAATLGLTEEDMAALGGGTPKDEEPEG